MTAEEDMRAEAFRQRQRDLYHRKMEKLRARSDSGSVAWNTATATAKVLVPWHRDEWGNDSRTVGNAE